MEGFFRKMVYPITVAAVTASTTDANGDGFVEEYCFIVVCIVGSVFRPSFSDGVFDGGFVCVSVVALVKMLVSVFVRVSVKISTARVL